MTDDRLRTGGAFDALPDRATDLVSRLEGRTLGGYRVGSAIGYGGMGYVLHATRAEGDFDRAAAIKIVPASIGSSELARRFTTEVRILARLNHPSIAQLYDAGETEEGWPYLVMEYVDGRPIDAYCQDSALGMDARVRLIVDVARAVSFAHARLIVHRDLKPSNVLVDADGKAKLLDFGIAKLLEPGTPEHTVGHRPMTPQYASPEQLLGADITIGSDIYQLGILMLAVFAGETPLASETLQDAIRKAAAGQDATISERAAERVPADLLAILTRCLHSDPDDRYPDVNALLSDLVRYQEGYPVEARKGTTFYRLRKLLRRNLPATLFAALALVIAIGGTATYALNMAEARRLAEERATTASQTLQALSGLIADTYSELIETRAARSPGKSEEAQLRNEPLRLLLQRTERLIGSVVTEQPVLTAELLLVQAVTNRQLGRTQSAREQLDQALALMRETGNRSGETAVLGEFIALENLRGDNDAARASVREALELVDASTIPQSIEARVLTNAVHVEMDMANHELAKEYAERAIAILEAREPSTELARAYVELGTIYGRLEDTEPFRQWMRKAVGLYTELEGPSYRGLISAYSGLAYSHAIAGEYGLALEYFDKELGVSRANYGEQHTRTALGLNNKGIALRRLGRYDEAIDSYVKAEAILRALPDDEMQRLGAIYTNLGNAYRDRGDLADAAATYEKGLALETKILPRDYASLLNNSGELLLISGRLEQAIDRLQRALEAKTELFGGGNISTARTVLLLARAFIRSGSLTRVPGLLQRAETAYAEAYGADHRKLSFFEFVSGEYALAAGDLDTARKMFLAAHAHRLQEYRPEQLESLVVALALARTELAAGNLREAREWLEKAEVGTSALDRTRKERIEYDIVRSELFAAEGRSAEARSARDETLGFLQSAFPARADWKRRLDGLR